jgi:osmotically-inducible protein OsmY
MSHDSQLQNAVLAELNWDPRVPAGHIGVSAVDGIVTLTGHTETYAEKHAAETATSRVKGMRGVSEKVEVRLRHDAKRVDDEIAAAIVNRFSWDVSIPVHSVVPTVENGWVTLTGKVSWHFEKDAAEQDVRRLAGVVGVVNRITIKPRVNVENVSDDITHAAPFLVVRSQAGHRDSRRWHSSPDQYGPDLQGSPDGRSDGLGFARCDDGRQPHCRRLSL